MVSSQLPKPRTSVVYLIVPLDKASDHLLLGKNIYLCLLCTKLTGEMILQPRLPFVLFFWLATDELMHSVCVTNRSNLASLNKHARDPLSLRLNNCDMAVNSVISSVIEAKDLISNGYQKWGLALSVRQFKKISDQEGSSQRPGKNRQMCSKDLLATNHW